jgi:hypothetical protein
MNVGNVIEKFYQRRQDADEGATRGAPPAELTIIGAAPCLHRQPAPGSQELSVSNSSNTF